MNSSQSDSAVSITTTTHLTTHTTITARMRHNSALPVFYWLVFGWYEPLLASGGALGALLYPEQVSQVPLFCNRGLVNGTAGVHPTSTVAARRNSSRPAPESRSRHIAATRAHSRPARPAQLLHPLGSAETPLVSASNTGEGRRGSPGAPTLRRLPPHLSHSVGNRRR